MIKKFILTILVLISFISCVAESNRVAHNNDDILWYESYASGARNGDISVIHYYNKIKERNDTCIVVMSNGKLVKIG